MKGVLIMGMFFSGFISGAVVMLLVCIIFTN